MSEPKLPKGRTIHIDGDAVRTRRILNKWSQGEFAQLLKMSEARISQIEKGGAKVFAATLTAMASVLNVPWSELVEMSKTSYSLLDLDQQESGVAKESGQTIIKTMIVNIMTVHELDD